MVILSYSETDVIVSRYCLISNGGFFMLIGKNAKASGFNKALALGFMSVGGYLAATVTFSMRSSDL